MRRVATLFAPGFLLLAGTASAETPHVVDIFGSVGVAHYGAGDLFGPSYSGSSASVGGGAGVRVWRGVGVEFSADVISARLSGSTSWTTYTGNALFHFHAGRTEPYVLVGLGGHKNDENAGGAFALGAGVKVPIGDHLYLRPDVRATLTAGGFLDGIGRASIGLGYRW